VGRCRGGWWGWEAGGGGYLCAFGGCAVGRGWGVSAGKGACGGGKTYQLFLPKKLFAFLGEVYSADTDFPPSIHAIAALNLAAQRTPNDLVTVAYADDADSVLG